MANWLDTFSLILEFLQVALLGAIAYFLWRYLKALGLIQVRKEPLMMPKEAITGEEPKEKETVSVDWMEL